MRDLLVSAAIILLLIGGWLYFDDYSNDSVEDMVSDIEEQLVPSVEREDWSRSMELMDKLQADWGEYKDKALLFLNTEELSEIDFCLAKSQKYVEAKDVSNSSGELNSMAEQMKFLLSREKITAENIL